MPIFQPIAANAEPIFWTSVYAGILAGIGLALRKFVTIGIESRDGVRAILQTLHGPKDSPELGLISRMEMRDEKNADAVAALAAMDVKLERRIALQEAMCKFNHNVPLRSASEPEEG